MAKITKKRGRGRPQPLPRRLKPTNGKTRQTRREEKQILTSGPLRKRPRTPPLPGMEDARIRTLDDVCASIAETRDGMNTLRQTEAELERSALKLMRKHDKTSWRSAGVELVRVPGEEKLRVRTSKANATAETEEEGEGEVQRVSVPAASLNPVRDSDDLLAMDAGAEG